VPPIVPGHSRRLHSYKTLVLELAPAGVDLEQFNRARQKINLNLMVRFIFKIMKIQENILLKDFTTLRIGGRARYFCTIKDEADLKEALVFAKSRKLPIFVLGGGSNLLVADKGFAGLVIKNEIKGFKFVDQDDDQVVLEVGAGESLDEIIDLITVRGLGGLENLSGIPGTIGGAAVQNAGAYGMELKNSLLSVKGINALTGKDFDFKKADCQYGYRDSFFKKNKKYIITAVTFLLSKKSAFNLEYLNLKDLLSTEKEINIITVRNAVLKIRGEKLPDWREIGTAGSYFKNPVISQEIFDKLKEKFGDLPGFPESKKKVKVPLAWLLDKICGLRGFKDGQVGLYEKQPIVLVNLGKATDHEVRSFSERIKKTVKEKIGIEIEEEVEFLK
jgi:UDP-N-acetylmuramate dehydrogenase